MSAARQAGLPEVRIENSGQEIFRALFKLEACIIAKLALQSQVIANQGFAMLWPLKGKTFQSFPMVRRVHIKGRRILEKAKNPKVN